MEFNGSWYAAKEATVPWKSAIVSGYAPTLTVYFNKKLLQQIYSEDPDGCKYITFGIDSNSISIHAGVLYFLTQGILDCSGAYPSVVLNQALTSKGNVYIYINGNSSYREGSMDNGDKGTWSNKTWFLNFTDTAEISFSEYYEDMGYMSLVSATYNLSTKEYTENK